MEQIPIALWQYIEGLKMHDLAKIASAVDDGVAFVSAGRTLAKQQFLDMLAAIYTAFPDWRYEHAPPQLRGDGSFAIQWRQSGTHTGVLAFAGFPTVAPTGKTVRIPEQFFLYQLAGERIVEIRPEPIPGGAPWGIFEQIGVTI